MSYILLQNEGPNAGNFVLKDTGKPDVVLGDYLEVSYIGPESKTHIPEGPGGYTVYGFPLVVRHSLIHNDDVESVLLHKDWPHVWEFRTTLECEAGVLEGVCTEFDVPYFSCRGYTSQSEMHAAALRLIEREEDDKTTNIIHLGDHDPSGIDMSRDIQSRLELFGSSAKIHRIALNWDQVQEYNPPPNPAKATDSRYESYQERFGNESWELDALEPRTIVALIRDEIEVLIDQDAWDAATERQQTGRDQLSKVSSRWDSVVKYLGNGDE